LNRIDEEQSPRSWQQLDLFDNTRFKLEILLAFFLLVDGVDNGLPFGLVATAQFVNLAFHFRVKVGHPLLKLFMAQELELETNKTVNTVYQRI